MFQAKEERNYHVFYQLVKGGDKQQFLLEPLESYNYLNQSGCSSLKDVDDVKEYEKLRMALTVLSIDDDMQAGIFSLVSAVLQIGNLQFRDVDGESVTLTDKSQRTLANVAKLLQIPEAIIARIVTTRDIIVQGNTTTIPYKLVDALENRHAMAKALYSRTFTWLIDQINQTTNPGENTHKFIGVLDIFGFENFALNSFEQLCINFTNEKLHKFFNHYVFALEQAEYTREQIKFEHIAFTDNSLCLELIEKAPSCVLRLLDEECRFPKGTDQTYLHKQHDALQAHPNYVKGTTRSRWDIEFGIQHFSGTGPLVVACREQRKGGGFFGLSMLFSLLPEISRCRPQPLSVTLCLFPSFCFNTPLSLLFSSCPFLTLFLFFLTTCMTGRGP